ncbi:MAG: A/G-specific adenine glycosylase [Chloroflexota bacterium]
MNASAFERSTKADKLGWYAFPMFRARYVADEKVPEATQAEPSLSNAADLHQALITWYRDKGRNLPWRHTRDPYRILVSEVMLQQTQVDRVLPKYEQFLKRFPDLPSLAAASLSDVLRIWSPLGYNRRARYLHLTARAAQDRFRGELPSGLSDLRSLPGIGRYTAGAVACFAFEQSTPVVDTNIRRVLGRLVLGQFDGISEASAWHAATEATPDHDAYSWNQGLMDLGATVCTPESPQCSTCPLAEHCQWLQKQDSTAAVPRRVRERRAEYQVTPAMGAARRRWRGRIIGALREVQDDEFVSLEDIRAALVSQLGNPEVQLDLLVESLVVDGLIERSARSGGTWIRLAR